MEQQGNRPFNPEVPTTLRVLEKYTLTQHQEKEVMLQESYQLKQADVVCGSRGSRETYNHVGNKRFRVVVKMRLECYKKATSRKEKSEIIKDIVDTVRSMGGGFVRHEEEQWYDIGNKNAREKVGNAIRAALKQTNSQRKPNKIQEVSQRVQVPAVAASDQLEPEQNQSVDNDVFDDFIFSAFISSDQCQKNNDKKNNDKLEGKKIERFQQK